MPSLQRLGIPFLIAAKALLSPVALGVIAALDDENGRILLVKQSYSRDWVMPGGGVDRGEAPDDAIVRELKEEVGLVRSSAPEQFGIYTRGAGYATNVVVFYRVRNAEIAFKPSWEIRDIRWVDPANLPPDTAPGTARRLAELFGKAPRARYW